MISDDTFDWETLELEDKRRTSKMTTSDYEKLGYDPNIFEAYQSTLDRVKIQPKLHNLLKGTILSVDNGDAIVDINSTENAYIDLSKENARYLEYLQPEFDVTVKVIDDPNKKGYINVSFSAAAEAMKKQEILESIGEDVAYMGKVDRLVAGGYVVIIDSIEVFMPGSLAGINKLYDFNILLNEEILVKPVNYERDNIVVSHRDYLKTLIPSKIEELKENKDTLITGTVTGSRKYGVFCEFNDCLTGMILTNDLIDEWKEKQSRQDIKPGDKIDFYIKEIISTKKIILTQVIKFDPWEDIDERYEVPCNVSGEIISIKEYGAFIKIEEDIVGLLHQSEFEEYNLEEGEEVDVEITRIDKVTKRIYLKLS